MHYRKCRIQSFWSLTCISDLKSGFLGVCFNFVHTFINLPHLSPQLLDGMFCCTDNHLQDFSRTETQAIFLSHSSIKSSSCLVWFGFCFSPQFLVHRRLKKTAGLDTDPCTCSWDKPKQGYFSRVYTQTLVSGRQLSQCGQWTVLVLNLKIIQNLISTLTRFICYIFPAMGFSFIQYKPADVKGFLKFTFWRINIDNNIEILSLGL